MKTKILSILLTVCMLFGVFAMSATATTDASTANGYSESNITYVPEETMNGYPTITELKAGTATGTIFTINSADELVEFANLVNASTDGYTGKTFYVNIYSDEIKATKSINMTGKTMNPIGKADAWVSSASGAFMGGKAFRGTFDGQGVTIKNLIMTSNATGTVKVGLFGDAKQCVIRNIVLDKSCYFAYTGAQTDVTKLGVGSLVAMIQSNGSGIIDSNGTMVTFLVENAKSSATVYSVVGYAGGLIGAISTCSGAQAYVKNVTVDGSVTAPFASGIAGQTSNHKTGTVGNTYRLASFLNYVVSAKISGTMTAFTTQQPVVNSVGITETNGTVVDPFVSDAIGYSFDRINRTPFAIAEITELTGGTNTTAKVYGISSPASLKAFSDYVNAGNTMAGITVKLMADLDMTGVTMHPIGSVNGKLDRASARFSGTFDGQGYTIDNLVMNYTNLDARSSVGLFGCVNVGTVRNVVLGSGCSFSVTCATGEAHAGSIVAHLTTESASGQAFVQNCFSAASVTAQNAGGIVGSIYSNSNGTNGLGREHYITNCTFVGSANGTVAAGGILGAKGWGSPNSGTGRPTEITNCRNAGEITGTAGALCGYLGANTKVTDCINVANIPNLFKDVSTATVDNCQNLSATPDAAWTNVNYVGSQVKKNDDGTYSVRFLATVNDLKAFNTVGFQIVAAYGNTTSDAAKGTLTTNKVFTSVGANADGVASTANPATWGGKYFVAVTISNINIDETVTFTVNTLQDGTPSAVAYTVAYQDGVLVAA